MVDLQAAPCESGGWISPCGKFYPCDAYQHDALAYQLSARWYNDSGGTRTLERNGWSKVFANGYCDFSPERINIDQVNTLLDILDVVENKVFRTHLIESLKLIFASLEMR